MKHNVRSTCLRLLTKGSDLPSLPKGTLTNTQCNKCPLGLDKAQIRVQETEPSSEEPETIQRRQSI